MLLLTLAGLGVIFCVYKSRVDISIGVIEEASDSFLDMPLCVFFPLVTFFFPVATYTGVSTALVLSLRSTDYDTGQCVVCAPPRPRPRPCLLPTILWPSRSHRASTTLITCICNS